MRLRAIVLVLSLGLPVLATACGSDEFQVVGTPRAAGVDGTVTVEEIEGGNYLVLVEVEFLPPPERISEDATVYIVWIKPEDGAPVKAGRLGYDEDDRTGTLRATTPAADTFFVVITAEEDETANEPSEAVVVQREVSM
jgi:hypothetical protein